MRPDRPSSTAAIVALSRAASQHGVTSAHGFSDPIAERLLPAPYQQISRAVARLCEGRPAVARAFWLSSLGMVDYLALRTLAIDEAIRTGLRGHQLVMLGAGLDSRAWRMPELADVTVYEVDHPATQAYKREHIGELAPKAKDVRFVTVDFTRDSLADRLAQEGHRADDPTFWVWEGVIMYLLPEAIRATLQAVRDRSSPGSRIAATYLTGRGGLARRALGAVVGMLSEPHVFSGDAGVMAGYFTDAGLRVIEDTGALDWATRWSAKPLVRRFMETERLILAER